MPGVDPVRKTKETYGSTFNADLLEQYKLYVQSAENISSGRIATGRYLLTLNAALLALSGLWLSNPDSGYLVLAIPAVGVLVSVLWYLIIKSYGNLNEIKFKLIHKLEERLPAALFKDEWDMARQESGKSYTPVTKIERWLPFLFISAHAALAIIWALGYSGMMGTAT